MTVTIRDVAARAGVGVSTVSRVINESGYVSDETRQRVLEAVQALDFRPNQLARGLSSGRSTNIALILPDLSNPFYAPLIKGVEAAARAAGYNVIICNAEQKPEAVGQWIRQLGDQMVKGILLAMDPTIDDMRKLARDRIPCTLVDQEVEGYASDAVLVNHRDGALQAVRHLIQAGHRRIAHITGMRRAGAERLAGYREALLEAGIPLDDCLVSEPGDFSLDHGSRSMAAFLQLPQPQRPTAVFCVNDLAAVGALQAADEAGLRVPDEISVVGYDDILWAQVVKPPLTTVAQPVERLGSLTTELLLRRVAAGAEMEPAPQRICLETSLVVRKSSAPPAV